MANAKNTVGSVNPTNNMIGPVIPAGTIALFFVLTVDEHGKPKFEHVKNGKELAAKTTTDIFLHDLLRYKPEFLGDALDSSAKQMDRILVIRKKDNKEWFMVTIMDGIDFEMIEWGY